MSWVRHIIALANMDILEMEKSALVILGLFNYTLSISFEWDVTPLYLLARQIPFSKPHNTRSLPLKFCVSYRFKNAFKNVHSSGEHLNQSINQSINQKTVAKFGCRGWGENVSCGIKKIENGL